MSESHRIQAELNEKRKAEVEAKLKKEAEQLKRREEKRRKEALQRDKVASALECEELRQISSRLEHSYQRCVDLSKITLKLTDITRRVNKVTTDNQLRELNTQLSNLKGELSQAEKHAIFTRYLQDQEAVFKAQLSRLSEQMECFNLAKINELELGQTYQAIRASLAICIEVNGKSDVISLKQSIQNAEQQIADFTNLVNERVENARLRGSLADRLLNYLAVAVENAQFAPQQFTEFSDFASEIQNSLKHYQLNITELQTHVESKIATLEATFENLKRQIYQQSQLVDGIKSALLSLNHQYSITFSSGNIDASTIIESDKNVTVTVPFNSPAAVNIHYQHHDHSFCVSEARLIVEQLNDLLQKDGFTIKSDLPPTRESRNQPASVLYKKHINN